MINTLDPRTRAGSFLCYLFPGYGPAEADKSIFRGTEMKKVLLAVVSALLIAAIAVSMAACAKSEKVKVIGIDLTDEEYGFCVAKSDDGNSLLNSINDIIAQLKGDGIDGVTIDSLFDAEVNGTAKNIGEVATTVADTGKDRSECFVVATNSGFKPFEYKEGAYFAGIDMHIAKIVAAELDKTLVILDMNFDSIVANVQNGTADIGMAGMTITADKEENVQFSTPYYNASQQIAVLESNTDFDNCKTREDIAEVLRGLEGKKIQAAAGYTGYDYAEQFTNLKLTAQEDIGTSVRELSNGRTDIVVGDKYTINEMVKALNADLS